MSAIPKWAQGLDWAGWVVVREPNRAPYIERTFGDAENCRHSITIQPNNYFEVFNFDGEIAWSATFPSVRAAHRAAMAIIEGMAR